MKPMVFHIALAVSAFAAGLGTALYMSQKIASDLVSIDILRSQNPWQFDAQNSAALHLHNIEAAQRGDTEAIVRANCILLQLGLRRLDPKAFGAAREQEVKVFLEHAHAVVSTLEGQGQCGPWKDHK